MIGLGAASHNTHQMRLALDAALLGAVAGSADPNDAFVWPADDLVQPLDLKNFDRLVGNGSAWVVEFYAPWCAAAASAAACNPA